MNGRHHLAAGAAFGAAFAAQAGIFYLSMEPDMQQAAAGFARGNIPQLAAGVVLYALGLVLPDCDQPNSTVGKYFHLPFEHRTWTHSVWFLVPMFLLGLVFWPFHFLWAGCLAHLLCDASSKCGVCFLRPVKGYKHFGDKGAKIKRGHFWKTYSTVTGEIVNCALIWALWAVPWCALAFLCAVPSLASGLGIQGLTDGLLGAVGSLIRLFSR